MFSQLSLVTLYALLYQLCIIKTTYLILSQINVYGLESGNS